MFISDFHAFRKFRSVQYFFSPGKMTQVLSEQIDEPEKTFFNPFPETVEV